MLIYQQPGGFHLAVDDIALGKLLTAAGVWINEVCNGSIGWPDDLELAIKDLTGSHGMGHIFASFIEIDRPKESHDVHVKQGLAHGRARTAG